LAKKIILLV